MIRPNRSSKFINWCEVRPCSFKMSSMIVFSVSVKVWLREGGFRNAETEILAVEFGDDV
jgi:hypothetical protein